jgi:hypothetical protein
MFALRLDNHKLTVLYYHGSMRGEQYIDTRQPFFRNASLLPRHADSVSDRVRTGRLKSNRKEARERIEAGETQRSVALQSGDDFPMGA